MTAGFAIREGVDAPGLLAAIVAGHPTPLLAVAGAELRVVMANEAAGEALERALDVLVGTRLRDLHDDDDAFARLERAIAVARSERSSRRVAGEFRVGGDASSDRRVIEVEVLLHPVDSDVSDGTVLLTLEGEADGARRRRPDAVTPIDSERARDRLLRLFRHGPVPMALTDVESGEFVDVNERWCRVTGYTRDELLGRSSLELGVWDDPEDRVTLQAAMETDGLVENARLRFRHRSGAMRHALGSIQQVVFAERPLWFSTLHDITREVEVEQEQARMLERRRSLERLGTAGEIAGGVAHDLNNVLLPILVNVELALPKAPAWMRPALLDVRAAAIRGRDLARKLLTVAHKQTLRKEDVDLGNLLRSSESILRRMVPESIWLAVQLGTEPAPLHADPAQIEQILVNLVANARDALGVTGSIEVTSLVRSRPLSADYGVAEPEGPHAYLVVEDDGPGIAPEIRDKIFEPFFTTKENAPSTGLGLSATLGVVEQHAGHIHLDTEPGRGTKFMVGFPLAPSGTDMSRASARKVLRKGPTVLVVEDDQAVREVTSRILRAFGCKVVTAADGPPALDLLGTRGDDIHVVVSDIVMPNMTGLELRREARRRGLTAPFVLVSGYGWSALEDQGIDVVDESILQKPFTPDQLVQVVAEAVAGADA